MFKRIQFWTALSGSSSTSLRSMRGQPLVYQVTPEEARSALQRTQSGTARGADAQIKHWNALLSMRDASCNETQALKRNTFWPKQDFVVLPLETDTLRPIMAAVGGTVPRKILHIQVETDGKLELGVTTTSLRRCSF